MPAKKDPTTQDQTTTDTTSQDQTATTDAGAEVVTPEPPRKLDQTVPGGRYIVNGQVVDANGKPLEESK